MRTALIIAALFLGDHPGLFKRYRHQVVHLDAAHTDETARRAHVARLLGGTVVADPPAITAVGPAPGRRSEAFHDPENPAGCRPVGSGRHPAGFRRVGTIPGARPSGAVSGRR
ncbi:hypothetical protein [Actinoplanes sp. NPDC020271]|uniref:hypothetical protein n=1 Tax=Actinoplanes sp. NPDC020271 TaxID=3363896 RepID=UPI0037B0F194